MTAPDQDAVVATPGMTEKPIRVGLLGPARTPRPHAVQRP